MSILILIHDSLCSYVSDKSFRTAICYSPLPLLRNLLNHIKLYPSKLLAIMHYMSLFDDDILEMPLTSSVIDTE